MYGKIINMIKKNFYGNFFNYKPNFKIYNLKDIKLFSYYYFFIILFLRIVCFKYKFDYY